MVEADVYVTVNEVFQDIFSDDHLKVNSGMSAKDISGWDSLRQIDIIVSLEHRFNVKFTARELDELSTVGDLVRIIVSKA